MSESSRQGGNYAPQIQKALADCVNGATVSMIKADEYLRLAKGELEKGDADDSVYEACRSMHQFYSSMHEFFLEEQRMIISAVAPRQMLAAAS